MAVRTGRTSRVGPLGDLRLAWADDADHTHARQAAPKARFIKHPLAPRQSLTAIRHIGLAKAAAQVTLAATAFSLRRWATLRPA